MGSSARRYRTYSAALIAPVLVAVLAGCTAPTHRVAEPTTHATPRSTPTPTTHNPVADTPSPAPPAPPAPSPSPTRDREAEYKADIAAWNQPLPPGYSWPAFSELVRPNAYPGAYPATSNNVQGIYRCILTDATWNAVFTDNDPTAAMAYARKADTFLPPSSASSSAMIRDGVVDSQMVAIENGVCNGVAHIVRH